jgi:hypothetical protein
MGRLIFRLLPKQEQRILKMCILIADAIFMLGTKKGAARED